MRGRSANCSFLHLLGEERVKALAVSRRSLDESLVPEESDDVSRAVVESSAVAALAQVPLDGRPQKWIDVAIDEIGKLAPGTLATEPDLVWHRSLPARPVCARLQG